VGGDCHQQGGGDCHHKRGGDCHHAAVLDVIIWGVAKRAGSVTLLENRLVEARADIIDCEPDHLEYTHAVLAQVGLPRSRTEERTFTRRSGQTSIFLEAGSAPDKLGAFSPVPLPYGAHPRLLLIHMSSEAVRTKSRVVDVGHSVRSFIERLSLSYNGRTLRHFKQQIQWLAAMHMTIAFPRDGRVTTAKVDPISKFDGWLSLDPSQKSLWTDTIELTEPFYETLVEHAVPLDPRAINALQGSALALDVYTWLAHRLYRVKEASGTPLYWHSLQEQFGQEYGERRDFKREFRKALEKAVGVYPDARVETVRGGIKLRPSPPPIPKLQVVVSGKFSSSLSREERRKPSRETVHNPTLTFPDKGSIHYASPWNSLARMHGGGWDIDMIAAEFRKHAEAKKMPLGMKGIEATFSTFCKAYAARRGRP
jgi:hypothetical protein